ncbi:DNA-processing protein DprA [Mycoplasma sp. 773]
MNEILLYFIFKYKGDWNDVYKAIKNKEEIKEEEFDTFKFKIHEKNKKIITILDDEYPKQLLNITKPPFVLFYEGNLNILKQSNRQQCIYLTGSYETKNIIEYIEKYKNDNDSVFINLYWTGLEQKILKTFLKRNFKVIILLPCGIEYAKNNLNLKEFLNDNCLIISEYPSEYHITKNAFYSRQRINACLCQKIILLSSLEKKYNGTINEFLDQGKDVQCLLFRDHLSEDQNIDLINEGATLINDNNQIC